MMIGIMGGLNNYQYYVRIPDQNSSIICTKTILEGMRPLGYCDGAGDGKEEEDEDVEIWR